MLKKIRARLGLKRDLDDGLAIFRFELEEEFTFQPGQYATLWLTHDGHTTPRPYSIASSPSESHVLEFYINLVDAGHLTPSFWRPEVLSGLQQRSAGTYVLISGPKGRFLLDPREARDLVLVASGTGLAPFMSMIRKLNEDYQRAPLDYPRRNLYLIHGVSYPRHLGYREELERLAADSRSDPARRLQVHYLPTISRPAISSAWTGLRGRAESFFDSDAAPATEEETPEEKSKKRLNSLLRPETHQVYVCGYPGTVENVVQLLVPKGFRLDQDLKREKYY